MDHHTPTNQSTPTSQPSDDHATNDQHTITNTPASVSVESLIASVDANTLNNLIAQGHCPSDLNALINLTRPNAA